MPETLVSYDFQHPGFSVLVRLPSAKPDVIVIPPAQRASIQ